MSNQLQAFKALITYAVIVPMAIFVGYMLADPLRYSTFGAVGVVLGVMIFPLLLKWHQPLLLFSWNMSVVIPFIKGQPYLWLVMSAATLGIAILERALNRDMRFVQVWSLSLPLIFFVGVILFTAKMTGGIGLRTFGSEVYGGRKYIFLLGAIAAYFALTAWRVPPHRAKLYVGLFFLGALTHFVGDLVQVVPAWLYPLFWFFPPTIAMNPDGGTRLAGTATAAQAVYFFILLRYGIRGVFLEGKPLRIALLGLFFVISLVGGYRSTLLANVLVFVFLFFLEGLHRTKLMLTFILLGILGAAALIPTASKLPYSIQRALAVVPESILPDLDPIARWSAEDSSRWRLEMWEALLPQVPQYLWLGKGYAISQEDWQMMGYDTSFRAMSADEQTLALAGDYHNGPLSIILPFGIWGVLAVGAFFIAGARVLYCNYRYGDPALKQLNTLLLALFLMRITMFLFVVGALDRDLWIFVGLFGFSVSMNNGMARPVPELATEPASVPVEMLPRPSSP